MWRGWFFAAIRTYRGFGAGDAVTQAFDLALQAIDVFPLGGDGLVEIVDHALVMRDASFQGVEAACVGHGPSTGAPFGRCSG